MSQTILNQIIDLTGLPKEMVTREFVTLLEKKGFTTETLTLENLRTILAEYLQDVLLKAREEFK